ncbi:MAG: zinc transporter ZupT [Lentisphaeria bacterium]|nr:zinc transporter ZupT [Lentisphaeria bacterium]
MNGSVPGALLLTTLAGGATVIGAAAAFTARRTNTALLSAALGLSGGVMVYIAFVSLLADANEALGELLGKTPGQLIGMAAFFGGMLIAALIDKMVPETINPHQTRRIEELEKENLPADLGRMSFITALAMVLHKFPEGIAVFASGIQSAELGIPVALAMALHNIPEGIAVSVPVYYATGSRKKAFLIASLTGLADPAGAILGWLLLMPLIKSIPATLPVIHGAVAGIMVFVTFDGLLPMAQKFGRPHLTLYGIISGMFLMALALAFL